MKETLSAERLRRWLPDAVPARVLAEADSTNLEARRWLAEGAPHGALVLARRQNAGRGRLGRSFASPPGGLYMSICLRCGPGDAALTLLTAAAAVAACRAVSALCGLELDIKWVNDLYYQGKKCCGILAEAVTSGGAIGAVVVGIGINYTTPAAAFAPELTDTVTSLFPGGGAPVPAERLAAGIHARLLEMFPHLAERTFLPEYRRRNIVPGRQVTVLADPPWQGTAVGIDDEARLVVRGAEGTEKALAAGEIRVTMK